MLTTLISLYIASALYSNDLPAASPQALAWNDSTVLTATAVPQKKPENIAPVIKAKSAIAVDLKSGYILFEKNIYDPMAIASLTKLMTATIILEENNLNDVVTVSSRAASTPGSKIWLAPGEKITVENLLNGVLINSANDAATALAEYNSGNIDDFVKKMNQKSIELGLYQTYFNNPTGLDSETSETPAPADEAAVSPANPVNSGTQQNSDALLNDNISTAYDLSLLGRYAFGKSFIRRTVIKPDMEITSTNGKIKHSLKNTDALLGSYLKVLGLKTGTTDQAGECLISVIENNRGNQILTVVLNSTDRYKEAKILADWVFRSYTW